MDSCRSGDWPAFYGGGLVVVVLVVLTALALIGGKVMEIFG
jgi:hypothetical protein